MIKRLAALWPCLLLAACATSDVGSYTVPGESLSTSGRYYVIFSENDDRALHEMLRTAMIARGLDASSGFADRVPADATYIVEYGSQWQWDLTWYLLHLSVRIYEPNERLLIASAHSERTSLVRRPAEEVVAETLHALFHEGQKGE